MTWRGIKAELVRRRPDRFEDWGENMLYVRKHGSVTEYGIHTNIAHISAICRAIGAVVESRFCVETGRENRVRWGWTLCVDPSAKYPKLIGSKDRFYDTREEAELAALGEWLEATSEKQT